MNYALSFPAVNGEVVTQGHADYCVTNGHATHKVDGVVSPICPRCGDVQDMPINAVKILPYGHRAIRQINVTTIRPTNLCTLSGDTFAMTENGYWKPTHEETFGCKCDDNTCAFCEWERFWG